jgi:hypothetical protein
LVIACWAVSPSQAAKVWESTFDVDADGVVDVQTANIFNVMIQGNTGGRQIIRTFTNSAIQADKAGRQLNEGVTLTDPLLFTGANWTDATRRITLAGTFTSYTHTAGRKVELTAGTGVVLGQYTVSAKIDDDTIEIVEDINGGDGDIDDGSVSGTVDSLGFAKATDSLGALYTFRWTDLPPGFTIGDTAAEVAGFIGNQSEFSTRMFLGCELTHRRDDQGDDFVQLTAAWVSVGHSQIGRLVQDGEVNLGQNATTRDLKLAIGYDSATRVLTVALYDEMNNKLAEVSEAIDMMPSLGSPDLPEIQEEVNDLALSHLGWSDFVGGAFFQTTTWSVDTLAYYDDADDPFTDVGPEPTGACCQFDGTCAITTFFDCNFEWQGAGTDCGAAACVAPDGACCDAFGGCTNSTITACADPVFWQGPSTSCPNTVDGTCDSNTCVDGPNAGGACTDDNDCLGDPPLCVPFGACCLSDASCQHPVSEINCLGVWAGAGSDCVGTDCVAQISAGCCQSDGTCTDERVENCDGEWQGLGVKCAATVCPISPMGACCQLDGTCAQARQMDCCGAWQGAGSTCGAVDCTTIPSPVWVSTFDVGTDSVVDVWVANPNKDMIGANTGGRLNIVTSSLLSTVPHDRAGRQLEAQFEHSIAFGTPNSGANWADATRQLTPSGGDRLADYTHAAGRTVELTDGTGVVLGTYAISAKIDNATIELAEDINGGDGDINDDSVEGRINPVGVAWAERSFGALYKYRYLDYEVADPGVVRVLEMAGFIRPASYPGQPPNPAQAHSSRSFMGTAWRHFVDGGEFQAEFGLRWMSVGHTFTGHKFDIVNFGATAPLGRNFIIAFGYHGPTRIAATGLYSAVDRSELQLVVSDIRLLDNLGFAPDHPNMIAELRDTELPFLGWSDYSQGAPESDGLTKTWSVDTLAYFDSPNGAFNAVGLTSPFLGACCQPDGTCADAVEPTDCAGDWQGLETTCAEVTCPGPPCPVPFADATDDQGGPPDGDVDAYDFGLFQLCVSGPGGGVLAGCECFDRDNDNDVDALDFDEFAKCATGPTVLFDELNPPPGCTP